MDSENPDRCSIDLKEILQTIEPSDSRSASLNRLDQYKRNNAVPTQEERRKQYLQSVKDRRQDFVAHARLLAFGENDDEEEEECEDEGGEEPQDMDTTAYRTPHQKRRQNKLRRYLKNQLMLSEWLVQLPVNFETEWLLVPCPVGKRCLVVASRGRTKVYSRIGKHLLTFSSLLPGGNARSDRSTYSILDCLFCKDKRMLYVLDIMCWKGHTVYDCDTSFRSYWVQTKLNETSGLSDLSPLNQNCFIGLNYHACTPQSIQDVISSPLPFPLDGLLFYHQACPYQQGVSPLVGWLKAFMVPEVMPAIVVPESLCADRPENYVSMEQYLVKAFKKSQNMDLE